MPSEPSTQPNGKGPLPLVLGVTGHRDLRKEDIEALKEKLRGIFSGLAAACPSTPLQLISGLAEGADRLAAHVALECGVGLVACLPMEKSLYEADFETAESRGEFETLLAKSARVVALPLEGNATPETVKARGPVRNAQYDALARYLITQSQILVALWDGVDTKLVGGTSSVVRMQLGTQLDGGDIDPAHPLDLPETGPVFHIVTPRVKNPVTAEKPCEVLKLWVADPSRGGAEEAFMRIYRRIDHFNRDALARGARLAAAREQSKEWVLPGKIRAGLDGPTVSLLDDYALADALAIYYQGLTRKSLRALIFWSGLPVVFLFECFAHCPESIQIWALAFYVAIILVTFGIYKAVKPGDFKTKYLDYRALAEGLRLQVFWRLAGLRESVADYYLRKQKTELEWIRNAIRFWNTASGAVPAKPDFALVRKHWIEDQLKFFTKAAARDHRLHQKEKRWTFWILFVTTSIALAHVLLTLCYKERFAAVMTHPLWRSPRDSYGMEFRGIVIIFMAVLPAIAGAMAAYSLKMAVREQEKQYRRMQHLFRRGLDCLDHALKIKDDRLAGKTVFDLGLAALEENGDWVVIHRERSVEMHLGG